MGGTQGPKYIGPYPLVGERVGRGGGGVDGRRITVRFRTPRLQSTDPETRVSLRVESADGVGTQGTVAGTSGFDSVSSDPSGTRHTGVPSTTRRDPQT